VAFGLDSLNGRAQQTMRARLDGESARKWLHLGSGGLALGLRWASPFGALTLCAGLLAFNLWIFPRLGAARLWRATERERGEAPGMLFYPVALLLVAVAARARLEILAGAWGILACGDAAATLVGRAWGRRRLPWNRAKSWIGSFAFILTAWGSAACLVLWTAGERCGPRQALAAAGVASVCAALAESLPWRLDDNLSVTLVGGGALFVGLEVTGAGGFEPAAVPGLGVLAVVALALAAWAGGAFDGRGAATGVVLALAALVGGGPAVLGLLVLFVMSGTAAGRFRRRRLRQGPDPARGARNALANGAVAAACGLAAAFSVGRWPVLALSAALAAATADTVGGEIGQAVGGPTRRVSDGRRVAPGTDGGVSWAGSAATLASAALVAGAGVLGGLLCGSEGLLVAAAGVAGAAVDSLLGATLERRGLLDNEAVNFLATLTAAWLAAQTSLLWP
jgi:uncharacterized protein (TIGR00297 family)